MSLRKRYAGRWLLLAGLALSAGSAGAKPGSRASSAASGVGGSVLPPLSARPEQLEPGRWVRYAMVDRRTRKAVLIRLAALSREQGGQWFEITLADPQHGKMVFRSLVEVRNGQPGGRVLQAIVQPPLQRPLQLPAEMARKQMPPLSGSLPKAAKPVGRSRITVPAGRFSVRHVRHRDKAGRVQEAWISDTLRGWPLVKYRDRRMMLELVGHGKDARSELRGKPIRLDPKVLRRLGLIR